MKNHIAYCVVICLMLAHASQAQRERYTDKGAYDKSRLIKVVRLKALAPVEIAFMVVNRGAAFKVTPEVQQEFRAAGANEELIDAIAVSYRPTNSKPIEDDQFDPSSYKPSDQFFNPSFCYQEVLGLLESGITLKGFSNLVRAYGINFGSALEIEEIQQKLQTAGATSEHLKLLRENIKSNDGNSLYYNQRPGYQSNPRTSRSGDINLEKYYLLRTGMTIIEAVRAIGERPKQLGIITGSGYKLVAYQWSDYSGEQVFILLRDGKLVFRSQRGLR